MFNHVPWGFFCFFVCLFVCLFEEKVIFRFQDIETFAFSVNPKISKFVTS